MPEESRLIGFTAPRARACFHARGVEISLRPFTWAICSGSFPRAQAPLQSSFAHSLPPPPFRARALLPGFRPSSRHHRRRVHSLEGSQVLDTFRPQVLTTSRRLSPRSSSRACFIPEPRSGRSARSGVCHLRAAIAPLRPICPLAVVNTCRSPGRILTATTGDLGFEALLRAGARTPRGW